MSEHVLLTLGRLPKGLELARALHKAGLTVHVADPWGWHLSRPSRAVALTHRTPAPNNDPQGYAATLKELIARYGIKKVFPISEEILHVANSDTSASLFAPDLHTLQKLHDKLAFIEDARSAGLTVPETYAANTPEAAALAQQTPYIIKPRNGCSGHRFQRYSRNSAIPTSERQSDLLVQRQVTGEEVSSFCIARDGVVLGSVVYRGRILAGTVACCFEQVSHRAADQWTKKFVGALGLTGFFGFDFIVDDNGTPWPLECNPRLTSGIHFMNADDLTAAVVDDGFRGKIRLSPTKMMMEGHTSLTIAYKDLLRPRKYLATLSTMARSEDVLFRLRDPAPFFLMTPMSWRILSGAVLKRRSFGQTATDDIVWTESISNDNRQEDVSIAEENDAEAHPIKTEVRKELHVAHGT